MPRQSRAQDGLDEARRKQGAPAVLPRPAKSKAKSKTKTRTPPPPPPPPTKTKAKTKAKAKTKTKTKGKSKARGARRSGRSSSSASPPPVETETTSTPAAEIEPENDSVWSTLSSLFDDETVALVDRSEDFVFGIQDLIRLELATVAEVKRAIRSVKPGSKAYNQLLNTWTQARKQLFRLLEKGGKKAKKADVARVPEGLRNIEPLKAPDPGREVDAKPTPEELPARYR